MSGQVIGGATPRHSSELRPHGRHARNTGSSAKPGLALAAVSFGVAMVGLDSSAVAVANPSMARDLHASLSGLQWITNAYLLALVSLLIFSGKLADRYGRRRVFLIGTVGFAATSVAIGLVGTVDGVIGFRVLQGMFGALLLPSTLAIIRNTFSEKRLKAAIGIWGAASGLSVAAGPIVAGVLVERGSWQSVFYINAPIAAVALLIGSRAIAESRGEVRKLDIPGILTLGAGLTLLVLGLMSTPYSGWQSGRSLGLIIGGLLLIIAFVAIEFRTIEALIPMRLFSNRTLSISLAVVVVSFFGLFGDVFFVSLYFQNVQGCTPFETGVRALPTTLGIMIVAPLSGALLTRMGPRLGMATGPAMLAAGLAMLNFLQVDSAYVTQWPAYLLIGAGVGWSITACSDAIVHSMSRDDAGLAAGLQAVARQLGGVLAITALGAMLAGKAGLVAANEMVAKGVPPTLAAQLSGATGIVGEGRAPTLPGMTTQISQAVVDGSHSAFVAGLHFAMTFAAIVVGIGAVLSLFIRSEAQDVVLTDCGD